VEARVEVSVAAQVEAAGAQVAALALAGRVAEEGSQVVEAAGPEPAEAKAGHPEEGLAEEPAERAAREGRGNRRDWRSRWRGWRWRNARGGRGRL
jgi:hypothetical protein